VRPYLVASVWLLVGFDIGLVITGCAHSPPPRPPEPICVTVNHNEYNGVHTVCSDRLDVIERFLTSVHGEGIRND
jgi:hypothetical protein